MKRVRGAAASLVLGSVAVFAAAACSGPAPSFDRISVFEQDGPPGGSSCLGTAIEGVLASSDRWLVGIASAPGASVRGVMWPHGYAADQTPSGLVLLDEKDSVVARVGQRVRSGGEEGVEGIWVACRPVVLASTGPS